MKQATHRVNRDPNFEGLKHGVEHATAYKLVINHQEEYSIWPVDREESSELGAFPGVAGYEPDLAVAHNQAVQGKRARDELRTLVPNPS